MDSYHMESVVHGHHSYKNVWTPFVGEVLHVEQEAHNPEDRFAVAVLKTGIVGHVPREISRIVWYFIEHNGTVSCEVTGHRKRGIGLEVPCRYTFCAKKKLIRQLQKKLDKRWFVQRPKSFKKQETGQ